MRPDTITYVDNYGFTVTASNNQIAQYVLRTPGNVFPYVGADWLTGRETHNTATKFSSVQEAKRFAERNVKPRVLREFSDTRIEIVKLETVPGETNETRRMLGETEQAKAGEVVKYALRIRPVGESVKNCYADDGATSNWFPLANAPLFPSLNATIDALVQRAVKHNGGYGSAYTVARVALSTTTTPSTVRETVVETLTPYTFEEYAGHSSLISAIRFDGALKVAEIDLTSGHTYRYSGVYQKDVLALVGAKSQGQHYNNVWKPKFGPTSVKVK
jgi:hypothetical protein